MVCIGLSWFNHQSPSDNEHFGVSISGEPHAVISNPLNTFRCQGDVQKFFDCGFGAILCPEVDTGQGLDLKQGMTLDRP